MSRLGTTAALLVSVAAGCASWPRPLDLSPPEPSLEVRSVALELPSEGEGRLEVVLSAPADAPPALAVTWDLAIDGHRFATGVEAVVVGDSGVVVRAPLAWRHLGWQPGPLAVDLAVEGVATAEAPRRRWVFRARRELQVAGRPTFSSPSP